MQAAPSATEGAGFGIVRERERERGGGGGREVVGVVEELGHVYS